VTPARSEKKNLGRALERGSKPFFFFSFSRAQSATGAEEAETGRKFIFFHSPDPMSGALHKRMYRHTHTHTHPDAPQHATCTHPGAYAATQTHIRLMDCLPRFLPFTEIGARISSWPRRIVLKPIFFPGIPYVPHMYAQGPMFVVAGRLQEKRENVGGGARLTFTCQAKKKEVIAARGLLHLECAPSRESTPMPITGSAAALASGSRSSSSVCLNRDRSEERPFGLLSPGTWANNQTPGMSLE